MEQKPNTQRTDPPAEQLKRQTESLKKEIFGLESVEQEARVRLNGLLGPNSYLPEKPLSQYRLKNFDDTEEFNDDNEIFLNNIERSYYVSRKQTTEPVQFIRSTILEELRLHSNIRQGENHNAEESRRDAGSRLVIPIREKLVASNPKLAGIFSPSISNRAGVDTKMVKTTEPRVEGSGDQGTTASFHKSSITNDPKLRTQVQGGKDYSATSLSMAVLNSRLNKGSRYARQLPLDEKTADIHNNVPNRCSTSLAAGDSQRRPIASQKKCAVSKTNNTMVTAGVEEPEQRAISISEDMSYIAPQHYEDDPASQQSEGHVLNAELDHLQRARSARLLE